jgi:hypothetical protein
LISLPGLATAQGEDLLGWLPSPDILAYASERMVQAGEPPGLVEALQSMGVPWEELVASPVSARAALMGYGQGRAFYHHELRGHLPATQEMAPERAVWEDRSTVPLWEDGILRAPKYFSFFQETVFPPYHPNHRSKWRVHELLHTLCGFYWNPGMSRFSCYLGSRLSELLPVVHWYGFDEVYRSRCPEHAGKVLYREFCSACEKTAKPYWEPSDGSISQASGHASRALGHYLSEMSACMAELETGRRHPVARPRLDSSSDAEGYLLGHWRRLTAWSFGAWLEHFMEPGLDYSDGIEGMLRRVDKACRALISDPVCADPADAARRRRRRMLQDVGHRAFCTLEWCSEEVEAAVLPSIEACAFLARELLDRDVGQQAVEQCIDELQAVFAVYAGDVPPSVFAAFPMLGWGWSNREHGTEAVQEGLLSGLPDSLSREDGWKVALPAFVSDPIFHAPGELRMRYARWLSQEGSPLAGLASLEAWLLGLPHRDEEAELFAAMPDGDWGQGRLRLNHTMRQRRFPGAAVRSLTDWPVEGDEVGLACIWGSGQPQLIELTPAISEVLEEVKSGGIPPLDETALGLLDAGALVWLPSPV